MNDLLIPLKEDSRFPMYRQIYDHIKNEIQKGKMKAGEKLPSSRILATTFASVAMEAWSVPGTQRAAYHCIRL